MKAFVVSEALCGFTNIENTHCRACGRPALYDVYCGAGGSAYGYWLAGFCPRGIDHVPMPRYPFAFVQMDALDFLRRLIAGEYPTPAAIHASPPCQNASRVVLRSNRESYPKLIEPTRVLLDHLGIPYIIENVEGAPVVPYVKLCGQTFGLRVFRHRWFESSVMLLAPRHVKHNGHTNTGSIAAYHTFENSDYLTVAGHAYRVRDGKAAMKIDWMTRDELNEAIPWAYTEFLGTQLMQYVEVSA